MAAAMGGVEAPHAHTTVNGRAASGGRALECWEGGRSQRGEADLRVLHCRTGERGETEVEDDQPIALMGFTTLSVTGLNGRTRTKANP